MPEIVRLRALRALLLDLDGVVYRGERALPGAVEFFTFLCERGLRFALITNNSTQTPTQFAAKQRPTTYRLLLAVAVASWWSEAMACEQRCAEWGSWSSRAIPTTSWLGWT